MANTTKFYVVLPDRTWSEADQDYYAAEEVQVVAVYEPDVEKWQFFMDNGMREDAARLAAFTVDVDSTVREWRYERRG